MARDFVFKIFLYMYKEYSGIINRTGKVKSHDVDTCDHHSRNLTICQSELSIQRRSIGKINNTAASTFGSKYMPTAMIYRGGIPFTSGRNEIKFLISAGTTVVDCT